MLRLFLALLCGADSGGGMGPNGDRGAGLDPNG